MDPDEILDCGQGSVDVAGSDQRPRGLRPARFRDVIAKSSDVAASGWPSAWGGELHRYMRDFGFGALTGGDLPGESGGLLRPNHTAGAPCSLASMSFGQEVGVTALQMAAPAAAVGDGGYLMKPLVVRRIEDADGRVVEGYKPVAVRRILEPDTWTSSPTSSRAWSRMAPGRTPPSPATWWRGRRGRRRRSTPAAGTPW